MTIKHIHHLNCGTMRPPGNRWLLGEGPKGGTAQMVCHVMALETERGVVVIDSGFGRDDIADPRGRLGAMFLAATRPSLRAEETAIAQLDALGFAPEDVTDIVLTHMDLDHAGGLADFPGAKLHVHQREWAAAWGPQRGAQAGRYVAAQWSHLSEDQVHTYSDEGDTWQDFAALHPLTGCGDDLALIPLAGHSRGHTGVAIRTEHGWLLHAGDAYFHHGCIHDPRGRQPGGFKFFERTVAADYRTMKRNQARLRELNRSAPDIRIFCAHDEHELVGLCAD